MLSTRDQLQIQGHIQTESEMIEKVIPCKWKSKESHGSNARIRKKKKKKKKKTQILKETVTRDKDTT